MTFEQYRFLIVEDDALVSALIASALDKLRPLSIDVAEDGKLAVGFIDSGKPLPDIIISDIHMPHVDGVEFVAHLARRQFAGGIILVSAADQRLLSVVSSLALAHHLNLLGSLSKPFSSTSLQNLLANFRGPKTAADLHASVR